MMTPLQITMRNIGGSSNAIDEYVRQRADKLERLFDRITKCHVTIETPHRHKTHGMHYRVRVDLSVPGQDLVVCRDPAQNPANENVYVAVDIAFNDVERVLKDYRECHGGRDARGARRVAKSMRS